jgi:hypothetical protein
MSDDTIIEDPKYPSRGRTWADVFVGATYITTAIIFLLILGTLLYFYLGEVPDWFFISLLMSLIFIPFLNERARDGTELFLIADQPFKLTEYRIGKRVNIEIDGIGTRFQSKSGVSRIILNDLDLESKKAKGSAFGSLTPIDQVRDLTTLQKLSDMLETTLKESRISAQTVGIEVEKKSIEIVDWALQTIYGSMIPSEVSEAFGVETDSELDLELTEDEILEDFE